MPKLILRDPQTFPDLAPSKLPEGGKTWDVWQGARNVSKNMNRLYVPMDQIEKHRTRQLADNEWISLRMDYSDTLNKGDHEVSKHKAGRGNKQ